MQIDTDDLADESSEVRARNGIISALIAYTVWGFLPVYFIFLRHVEAVEVLLHRVIWAVPFGALIILYRHQGPEVRAALRHRETMLWLFASSLLIAGNWLVYIWAVQQEQIFQASLGYYINPLLFAVVGVLFLGEKLRKPQAFAVLLAAIGVTVLTVSGGSLPAIALFLGTSFTMYGVIRKKVVIGGMPGLFIETIILLPFCLLALAWYITTGAAAFGADNLAASGLLMLAGPLTVIPLLFFALAARRLNLSTVGMMQFIAPTLQFAVGVVDGEVLTKAHIICFSCIWTAVVVFSVDAWRASARRLPPGAPA